MLKIVIRERRMERYMTQKDLAARLISKVGTPLHQAELSRYENGKVEPPLDIILQIAEVLNCKVEELVSRQ